MTETDDRPSQKQINKQWDDLFFGVQRSVRYHSRRTWFFDFWHRVTNGIGVIFGSAVIVTLLNEMGVNYTTAAAALVSVFFALDLVIETTARARLHDSLCRRFITLERQMVSEAKPITPPILAQHTDARLEIELDEPPVCQVLDILCRNELMIATGGYKRKDLAPVRFYDRWFAHISDLGLARIKTAWQEQSTSNS